MHLCLLVLSVSAFYFLLRSDFEIRSKLVFFVFQSDMFAKLVLIELSGCKSLCLMQVSVFYRAAIFANQFTNRVIRVDTSSNQISVRCGRIRHRVQHLLVVLSKFYHVLLVQNLFGENFLHNTVAVVHFLLGIYSTFISDYSLQLSSS